MMINLSEIMSVKGKIKHMEVPLTMEEFWLDGMKYEIISKDTVKLTISHIGEKRLLLEANTKVSLLIPCSRCLEGVETFFDISISKELDFNDTDNDRVRELDETNYMDGYNLDVDILVYNEILIEFPMQVLCKEDCKGICFVCGKNQNENTCDCDKTVGDPRMSAIRDIFNNG